MRGILWVCIVSATAAGACGAARAEATCSGNACTVLAVAPDGCSWANKGDKAVRFSLVVGGAARVVTVLAPGETFKEIDKKFCIADNAGDKRYEASFAVLAKVPADDKEFTLKPPAKLAAPASAEAVAVAPAVALPRVKPAAPPAYPPSPRPKPEVVQVAAASSAAAVAPTAAVQAAAPAPGGKSVAACTQGCPPILFKVIDDCLWVLNLNPRPVAFEAEIGDKRMALALEAADGARADEHAAAAPAKDAGAVHMRLKDPFQSAGSGIPVYRARLGAPGACVKSRDEISRFSAAYSN